MEAIEPVHLARIGESRGASRSPRIQGARRLRACDRVRGAADLGEGCYLPSVSLAIDHQRERQSLARCFGATASVPERRQ